MINPIAYAPLAANGGRSQRRNENYTKHWNEAASGSGCGILRILSGGSNYIVKAGSYRDVFNMWFCLMGWHDRILLCRRVQLLQKKMYAV